MDQTTPQSELQLKESCTKFLHHFRLNYIFFNFRIIATGTIFWLRSKNWWKTVKTIKFKIQLYAICIFLKKVYTIEYGAHGENFCVESKLTVCKVTFNCKLQKMGRMMYYLLPNNFAAHSAPGSRAYV